MSVLNGLFNIGVCLKDKGDTNKAIAYLEKALQLTVKVFGKNHINVSDTLFHLGLALKDVRDFDKSKSIFEDSLKLLKETKNYENERSLYILDQLGDLEMEEERFVTAEYYLNEALCILICIHRDGSEAENIMFKLASLYLKHKNNNKVITFFEITF